MYFPIILLLCVVVVATRPLSAGIYLVNRDAFSPAERVASSVAMSVVTELSARTETSMQCMINNSYAVTGLAFFISKVSAAEKLGMLIFNLRGSISVALMNTKIIRW